MQSCLETRSLEQRHIELARSDYNQNDVYSVTHEDARATGTQHGKGTGHVGGTSIMLPNCTGTIGEYYYGNFDTAIESGAGNCQDNEMRNISLARSLYNHENAYSLKLLNRDENISEGQFVNGATPPLDKASRMFCELGKPGFRY